MESLREIKLQDQGLAISGLKTHKIVSALVNNTKPEEPTLVSIVQTTIDSLISELKLKEPLESVVKESTAETSRHQQKQTWRRKLLS